MVDTTRLDARFGAAKRETYGENLNWDSNWELRYMTFKFIKNNNSINVVIYQITNKANPLLITGCEFQIPQNARRLINV